MNASWRNGRDAVVVILLLAIPFFFLRSNVRDPRNLSKVDRFVLRISAPFQYLGSWVGRGITRVVGSYVYLVDVKEDNKRLQHENAMLRERVRKLEGLEAENRKLKRYLGLKEELPPETLTAQVIAKITTEFRVMSIRLDKPNPVVKQGWVVLSDEGVVGVVLRGEAEYLEVQLAADPSLAIDVIDERTGARGTVRGTSDMNRYITRVEYMRRSDEVAVGDLLVTSGVGARFSRGLPVARITKINNRGFGEFQEVEAEPVVSFSRLEEVFLVPPTGREIATRKETPRGPGKSPEKKSQ